MKNLLYLSVSFLLMFASCSNDDEAVPGGNPENGQLTFDIAAVNQLNASSETRGPVYSQEAVQHVTDVKVYAFKNDGTNYVYVKTYDITGWTDGTTFKRYAVASGDNLVAGDYKFLGVGRDANDMYTLPTLLPTTKYQDMVASIAASGNETEIFAGTTPYMITALGSRVNILMTRQVAGVLGYFKNVPAAINGTAVKYLRLSVSNSNHQVNLTTGNGAAPTGTAFNIINMDLSGQTVNGDVYAGNDLGSGVVKLPNTQLMGSFFLPVPGISMTLGLYDASSNPLRTWVVTSLVLPVFDIMANHFYTLGKKSYAGTTTGDPGNPGDPTDDDAPIDLFTDQNISITITPNWTLIHDLTINNIIP